MLADMAEGSADYGDQDRYDGEDYDGEDDFSGSGDHHDGSDGEFHAANVIADSSIIILFVIPIQAKTRHSCSPIRLASCLGSITFPSVLRARWESHSR